MIIQHIKDTARNACAYFKPISKIVVHTYKAMYSEPQRDNIRDILTSTSFFDGRMSKVQNEALVRLVSKGELHKVFLSFQAGKSPNSNGWIMEFFINLWDLLVANLH